MDAISQPPFLAEPGQVLQIHLAVSSILGLKGHRNKTFTLELVALVLDIRSAMLNDYRSISKDLAKTFLARVALIHPVFGMLRCVLITGVDFLFFVNRNSRHYSKPSPISNPAWTTYPVFVNVSGSLKEPDIVSIQNMATLACSCSVYMRICQWLNDNTRRDEIWHSFDLESEHPQPIVALTGLLLEYPVVYCCNTLDRNNNLGGIPLDLFQISAQLTAGLHDVFGQTHTLFSFTAPHCLYQECATAIRDYTLDLQQRALGMSAFVQVQIKTSLVTKDVVVM
ncbi:hypothetical protein BASA50_000319 [Batrachochytrium salamandrivorans]|uniref:Uncharacterized protein n=1 Tax=Batrachochytrium salamandrivorans TaxID=1357716 RepID=A0ABQ8EWV4_9FUNG|nr:hypothetical protein BASA60_005390 [Batrachochytrium salamandrivorans]KAH6586722.1 hypothetical protein BASA50_000319 [Batrachochytrium salamandrivorans]KAH6599212.1 hypothetical protein BASA61_002629 [Batrachochytrium salamandrivorans]KAH9269405.1 hypothetical protein BASA83_008488 [Batrachochytrium salamandrivorans]